MSRLLVVIALVSILPATAFARTIRVPSDEATIQRAVFVAADGDTVTIGPGTYMDRFTIHSKNIVLRGEAGAEATVIDGSSAVGNVITLHGVNRSMVVEDITITGGRFNTAAVESVGTGIYINQGNPTIQRCTLTGNQANTGGGIAAYFFSRPLIKDCLVIENQGGGIFIETGDGDPPGGLPQDKAQIHNSMVIRNSGFGISVIKGAKCEILRSTISHNTGDGVRSEITAGGGGGKCWVTIKNTLITNNGVSGIIRRDGGVCFTLECNDVWSNPNEISPRNWVGVSPGDPCFSGRGSGSLSINPFYSDPDANDFSLQPNSPLFALCRPDGCGALGANNECTVSVEHTNWGSVKALYR